MWVIDSYRLDPNSFSLTREGEPIALQRRPLDLLLYLIARRDEVVLRDELLSEIWGGVVVSDGALSTAIYEIRAALGDLERAPGDRWVATVRGRGFRFIGPAQEVIPEAPVDSVPFVGRQEIAQELARDAARAASGHGGVHVVEGLAGIGKTRLIQEVTRKITGADVFTVFCEPAAPPFWPWVQLARALSPGETAGSRDSSWLAETDTADERSSRHFERVEQMTDLLTRAAKKRPLVLIVEDLHWADGSSIELLDSLASRIATRAVQIFATLRTEEHAFGSAWKLTSSPSIKRDRLEPLQVADLFRFIGSILGKIPSPELVGWIRENSGGVPLMVRELAEQIAIAGEQTSMVPELAQRIFARRFDGLADETRFALGVAALCGERFDVPLVEAAAEGFLPEDRKWILEGLEKGVLNRLPDHPLRFAFRHALLRDAAEGLLSQSKAAEWHGRLAVVIERQHPDPRGAALSQLAHHSAAAAIVDKNLERPLHYALLAARRAIDVFAWEDVRVHSEHILGWIEYTPPGAQRDSHELEAALLRCAGIASYSGHVEETAALLARIEPLRERASGDHTDKRTSALVEAFRFANARNLGDYDEAFAGANAVDEIGGLMEVTDCWRVGLASVAGNFHEATFDAEWGESLPQNPQFAPFARRCGRDPGVDRLGLSAFAFWARGRDADAVRAAERAVRWAEEYGDARGKVWALFILCLLHDLRRDWTALRTLAPEIDQHAQRHDITPWLGVGGGFNFWGSVRENADHDLPGNPLASILRDRGHATSSSLRTALLMLASRIFTWDGDHETAEATVREGLAFCERTDERFMHAELQRQLGKLRMIQGDPTGAQRAWQRAIEIAREQGHIVAEIRTLVVRLERGDRDRLAELQRSVGPQLGPWERSLLDRAVM